MEVFVFCCLFAACAVSGVVVAAEIMACAHISILEASTLMPAAPSET